MYPNKYRENQRLEHISNKENQQLEKENQRLEHIHKENQ
jgi:hypothetical protein